jgi:hypothetical protein
MKIIEIQGTNETHTTNPKYFLGNPVDALFAYDKDPGYGLVFNEIEVMDVTKNVVPVRVNAPLGYNTLEKIAPYIKTAVLSVVQGQGDYYGGLVLAFAADVHQVIRDRALAKLSPEERKALGV